MTILAGKTYVPGYRDGPGATALFNLPYGIATDGARNIYVGESHSRRIRKITSDGMVSTIGGSGMVGSMDGIGTNASFYGIYGITLDHWGNLYLADAPGIEGSGVQGGRSIRFATRARQS